MMMPENFTAVNSEVVYGGADLFSILADTTAPVWNAANVKTFNTNLLTILSNTFVEPTVKSTLGVMFGGQWGDEDNGDKKIFGDDGEWKKNFYMSGSTEMNGFNKFMRTLGAAAAVYTLGTTNAKNVISENIVKINSVA